VVARVAAIERPVDGAARGPQGLAAERTGELANTIGEGVDALDSYVRLYLPQMAIAVTVPLMIGATVFVADPISGVVLAITWPLIPLFTYLIGGHARERTRQRWLTLSRLSARLLDALQGLATLKAFGRSRAEADAIALAGERFREVTLSVLRVAFVSALVLELLATMSTAIVAVGIGLRLLYGRLEFASALTVLVLTPEFYRPLRALGAAFHAGMSGRESGRRIAELLTTSPSAEGPTAPLPVSPRAPGAIAARSGRGSLGIRFDHVSYTYPGRVCPALPDLTLVIDRGETVALVGPSGAGKSTVARLLLRFAEPTAGSIHVEYAVASGDVGRRVSELAGIPHDEWRQQLAWVPQRPHLFHGSILENLLVARPDATIDEAAAALRLAHADEFVAELPGGMHTSVGEHGARLSGGEAQRLALARAFLRDAPLVVLDEPTAELDPETERLVSDAIARLRRGRTVLLIAHRLTTVRDADRIVLLDAGRVVEQGPHDALIAAQGRYAALVAAYSGPA
jgi:thiol reductant ABC exporter CydD subunit